MKKRNLFLKIFLHMPIIPLAPFHFFNICKRKIALRATDFLALTTENITFRIFISM